LSRNVLTRFWVEARVERVADWIHSDAPIHLICRNHELRSGDFEHVIRPTIEQWCWMRYEFIEPPAPVSRPQEELDDEVESAGDAATANAFLKRRVSQVGQTATGIRRDLSLAVSSQAKTDQLVSQLASQAAESQARHDEQFGKLAECLAMLSNSMQAMASRPVVAAAPAVSSAPSSATTTLHMPELQQLVAALKEQSQARNSVAPDDRIAQSMDRQSEILERHDKLVLLNNKSPAQFVEDELKSCIGEAGAKSVVGWIALIETNNETEGRSTEKLLALLAECVVGKAIEGFSVVQEKAAQETAHIARFVLLLEGIAKALTEGKPWYFQLEQEIRYARRLLFEKFHLLRGNPQPEKDGQFVRSFCGMLLLNPMELSLNFLVDFLSAKKLQTNPALCALIKTAPHLPNNIGPRSSEFVSALMLQRTEFPPTWMVPCSKGPAASFGAVPKLAFSSAAASSGSRAGHSAVSGLCLAGKHLAGPPNSCWAQAAALVLHAIARRQEVAHNSELAKWKALNFVLEHGANEVLAKSPERIGLGGDASVAFARFVHDLLVAPKTRFNSIYGFGDVLPPNAKPLAAMRHVSNGAGHWTAILPDSRGAWIEHDEVVRKFGKVANASWFIWLRPEKIGGLLVCGGCPKPVAEHADKDFALTCAGCKHVKHTLHSAYDNAASMLHVVWCRVPPNTMQHCNTMQHTANGVFCDFSTFSTVQTITTRRSFAPKRSCICAVSSWSRCLVKQSFVASDLC
jgi:hypothetical protein